MAFWLEIQTILLSNLATEKPVPRAAIYTIFSEKGGNLSAKIENSNDQREKKKKKSAQFRRIKQKN